MQGGVARRCLWLLAATLAMPAAAPPPAAAQDDGTWTAGEPLPTPRRLLAAAEEGGRLYALGGCGSPCFSPPLHVSTFEETLVEVFDPDTGRWSPRRPMPYVFFGGAAAAPGDSFVYTVGGVVSGATVMRYDPDPDADAWSLRAPLPTPRHGLAAAADGEAGVVYAVGGSDGRAASAALEIYEPQLDRWRRAAPMPTPRAQLAAAVIDGRLYAIGGSPDCCGGGATAAVEVYDPATDAWSAAAPLPSPRQVSAAAAIGGRLYVFFGFVPGAGVLDETLEYDPATDRWRRLADVQTPPDRPAPRDQAAVAVLGGLAHLVGGSIDCHCKALGDVDVFDPPKVIVVPPVADLSCALAASGAASAEEGAALTLTVRNAGPDAATGARVTLDLPPRLGALVWTCAPSPGAVCPAADTGGLDAPVDLPAGGTLRFSLAATVAAATTCPLSTVPLDVSARASVPAGTDDPRRGNDACKLALDYQPAVDLALVQRPDPPTPLPGRPAGFVLVVSNEGPDAACGASLTSFLSPGLAAPSWTCAAPGTCVPPADAASGSLDLLPGQSAGLAVGGAVAADPPCRIDHTATIAPPPGVVDDDPGDNTATASLLVALCPLPTATKTVLPRVVEEGELVEFVVKLVNPSAVPLPDGPGDEWVDPLPPETLPVEISADAGVAVLDGQTARWNGVLPAAGSVEIRITAVALPGGDPAPCNQGFLAADGDGDGVVDLEVPTDDPAVEGTEDPTCFEIEGDGNGGNGPPLPIPALDGTGRWLLIAMLTAAGVLALRARREGGRRRA